MSKRLKLLVPLALVAAALVLAALPAQEKKDEALPADLDRVPRDGVFFASLRCAELWKSDALKPVQERLGKDAPDVLKSFETSVGLPPDEIERLTLVMLEAGRSEGPLMLVGTAKAYDKEKVLGRVGKTTKHDIAGQAVYAAEKGLAYVFFTDRAYAAGPLAEVRALVGGEARKEGPLAAALKTAAAGKDHVVVGVNVGVVAKAEDPAGQRIPDAFKPLTKATLLTVAAELSGDAVKGRARLSFGGAADAKAAEQSAKAGLELSRAALPPAIEKLAKEPGVPKVVTEFLKKAQDGLMEAKLSLDGADIQLAGEVKMDSKLLGEAALETTQLVRRSAMRLKSQNNLRQLGIAMHNYHDTYGNFPPAAVYGKDGKPLLSWRVLLLPYLEQDALFKEFHLDEPWDSEHNKKLLEKMPAVFAAPGAAAGTTDTPYQAFVGKNTVFEGRKGAKVFTISDGTSNTLMFVEAAKPVPWTKPEDITFDDNKLLPRLGGIFPDGFNAVFFDGAARFIPRTVSEDTLRLLVMPNDGMVIPNDF